jgi:hypothetical protein
MKPIAIKPAHKGKLHAATGTPKGETIPESAILSAKKSKSPAVRKEATFAENARHWAHPSKK